MSLKKPFIKVDSIENEEKTENHQYIYTSDSVFSSNNDTLIEVHIADIHFGNKSTKIEDHFNILMEQFIKPISTIHFDLLSINGDLFDHKVMANSDVVMYAIKFIGTCVQLCRTHNATLVLLEGTSEHDADQLKLFYHYLEDPSIDIRIVETARFEIIKGHRFLYMPEEYSMGGEYYDKLLSQSGWYDSACIHGTIAGTVRGANERNHESIRAVFDLSDFKYCRGPIICGHVHKPQVIEGGYIYYSGCPIRYKYGEEEPKGFLICLHNYKTREFYVHFQEIESFRYDTINIDDILSNDPKDIINYIQGLKASGIDNIRIQFSHDTASTEVIRSYFKSIPYVKVDDTFIKKQVELEANIDLFDDDEYSGLEFVLDETLDKKEILCRYANFLKGYIYVTVDELNTLLKE